MKNEDSLHKLFYPETVTLIGASSEKGKVGNDVLYNLIQGGFKGKLYPVNPKRDEILGVKVYHDISDIPDKIDLAVFVVSPKIIIKLLPEVVAKGCKNAIIISAGFKEVGREGALLEKELKALLKKLEVRALGPNCLGIISTNSNLNASFAAEMPKKGKISFISQSGALLTAVLDWSMNEGIGFSKIISLGNKADISEIDAIEFLGNDPETDVILGYIEGVVDGQKFIKAASKVTKKKPILLIKAGSTSAGARAASSHTGTLAGSDKAFTTAFKQSGIIRIHEIDEIFELAKGFSQPSRPKGNRLAVITNAGGPGIISADASEKNGINLPPPHKNTIEKLKSVLPPTAALFNPIDIIGDAKEDRYENTLNIIKDDKNFDGILVILTPQSMTDATKVAESIVNFAKTTDKPVFTSFMGGELVDEGIKLLIENDIPNFQFPDVAIKSFSQMVKYAKFQKKPIPKVKKFNDVDKEKVKKVFEESRKKGIFDLSETMVTEVFEAYGFRFPDSKLVKTLDDAVIEAENIGFPLVMKIASPDILHKSDIGGVVVNINNLEDVVKAFMKITANARRTFPKAIILGVEMQKMIKEGKEIILGMTKDSQFGPLIMFGLGGIYVEVLKDVSFRVAPISEIDAGEMVRDINSYALLSGVRGEKSIDFDELHEMIMRLSQLVTDFPEIVELDLNPVKLLPKGEISYALDARLTLSSE